MLMLEANSVDIYQVPVTNVYDIRNTFYTGAYGKIYFARPLNNKNGAVVIKEFMSSLEENEYSEDCIQEIASLCKLKHPNIIKPLGIHITLRNIHMVLPYYEYSLETLVLNSKIKVYKELVKKWLYELLSAVKYLHENGYIHRDIKPNNILIDNGTVVLIDMGISVYMGAPGIPLETEVQALWYRAPEVLMRKPYNYPIDIWSIGMVGYFVEMGTHMISSKKEEIVKNTILDNNFPLLDSIYDDELRHLLHSLLKINPHARPKAHDAMAHRYFSEYKKVCNQNGSLSKMNQINLEMMANNLYSVRNDDMLDDYFQNFIYENLNATPDTILTAYHLFNFIVPHIKKDQYHIYSQTCVHLASKLYEITKIEPKCSKTLTQIAETHLLVTCHMNLHFPLVISLYRSYIWVHINIAEIYEDFLDIGNYLSLFTMFSYLYRYGIINVAKCLYNIVHHIIYGEFSSISIDKKYITEFVILINKYIDGGNSLIYLGISRYYKYLKKIKTSLANLTI